jgi:ABC-2 type transport system ATP-binding protein
LCKVYGTKESTRALDHFNLEIPTGSFFGLLGKNGAGKSTFINILAGITVKTAGKISVFDYDLENQRISCCYQLGIVPQELVIDPFFTVEETLDIYAGYYGISKKYNKTAEIIEALGLSRQRKVLGRNLSGGMKRRLLIGKAMVHSPKLLILDEPTAGVDVDLRMQLWKYVQEINRQGTTILLTTHYLEEAQQLCDRIAIMHAGKIIKHDFKENLLKLCNVKHMHITATGDLRGVLPKLSNICSASISKDNKLILEYDHAKTTAGYIIRLLHDSGLDVLDIFTKESTLEDIFLSLVNEA